MNKQTGYWAYFPLWLGVIIPGHRDDFGADWAVYNSWLYANDPPLPCFMGLCVWILHHNLGVPASSDPSWPLESKADSPECCGQPWTSLLEYYGGNSPGPGPFLLMSGFLLSFTHLKSLFCLVRQSVPRTLCLVISFLETVKGWLWRTFEIEKCFCAEMPIPRFLAGDNDRQKDFSRHFLSGYHACSHKVYRYTLFWKVVYW